MELATLNPTKQNILEKAFSISLPVKPSERVVVNPASWSQSATLSDVLRRFADLPAQTGILGVCEDELPVLVDFADPDVGALLAVGDPKTGKTNLLHSLVESTIVLNSPQEVQFAVLTRRAEEWEDLSASLDSVSHCLDICNPRDRRASDWILKLSAIANQRQFGRQIGPALLLVIDDFSPINDLDFDVQINLNWLLREGANNQVWTIASMTPDQAAKLDRWYTEFRTHVFGFAAPSRAIDKLGINQVLNTEQLHSGRQFAVKVARNWLPFWVPVNG